MFYSKYLDNDSLMELCNNYDIEYLSCVDENNFDEVYHILKKYDFSYIEDIILRYLDIFQVESNLVEKKINNLIKILGSNYQEIISENISYLEYIVRN